MNVRYRVELSQAERDELTAIKKFIRQKEQELSDDK